MTSSDDVKATTSPEQHRRLKQLVEAALDLPTEERTAYLAEQCHGDEPMLVQARELLELYRDEDVLEVPGADLEQIGPYRLITELGAGGMGVVYLAQREDGFSRTVAVKVIRRGMDTDFFLTRFHQEREILGALDHPGIVRIVDAGSTSDGRPYLVMDFVDGVRIDAFCEELSIRDRVALFLKVCAAVQHAHRNLIVHRDLKPGNILVTPDGQPKLLDFGIAKVLDQEDNDATSATIPIMTRQYASPEQVRGQRVNTSSDVYALGLILYELLAGARPYDLKDMPVGEAERVICSIEPPEPSKLTANRHDAAVLRGDLDRILLMALRKEPERRYPSVEALAADLEKYLHGMPVSAQRDTLAYRTSKFVQRNWTKVLVGGAMAVLVIAGGASTFWQARIAGQERSRAEREAALARASEADAKRHQDLAQQSAREAVAQRDRAEQKVREAERERLRAETGFREAQSMANSMLFEFHSMIRNLPGATEARELLIRRSLENLERLNREAGSDPGLQSGVAAGYEQLGQLQAAADGSALGDIKGAFDSQSRALEIRRKLAAAYPENTSIRRDLAASNLRMAEILLALKQPLASLENARTAQSTYDSLVRATPNDVLSLLGLAASQQASGQALESAGRLRDAIAAYERHTGTRKRIEATASDDLELQSQTAEARDLEARALEIEGRFGEAMRIVQQTGAIYRRTADANPNSMRARRNVIQNYRVRASLAERMGELTSARQSYQYAISLMEKLSAADPRNSALVEDLTALRGSYANTLFRMGLSEEAIQQFRSAVDAANVLFAKDPDSPAIRAMLAGAQQGLGQALLEAGRPGEAETAYQQAIQLFENLAATAPRDIGIQMNRAIASIGVGRILRDRDDLPGAERILRQSVSILEKIMPGSRDHRVLSNLGIAYNRLADVYRKQGKDPLALVTYSRTEPIVNLLLNQDPRNSMAIALRAESANRAGQIHEARRDWPAALRSYQQSIEADRQIADRDPGDLRAKANLAESHFRVCEVRFRLLQYDPAFDACGKAISLWQGIANNGPGIGPALARAGDIRMAQAQEDGKQEHRDEACRFYRDAGAILKNVAEMRTRMDQCDRPR